MKQIHESSTEAGNFSLIDQSVIALLISERVGLLRSLDRLTKGIDEPEIPILYRAILGRIPSSQRLWAGVGKGCCDAEAAICAIAEALERYCALWPNEEQVVVSSFLDLRDEAINPIDLVLFSEQQYNSGELTYLRYDPTQAIGWSPAVELPSGARRLVPASLVYLRAGSKYRFDRLARSTSNGLAAGMSASAAILAAILELIERDIFLMTWMHRLPGEKLKLEELPSTEQQIVDHYRSYGIDLHVHRLVADLPISVMMAIAVDRRGKPPLAAVGLGCSLEPLHALRKALFEVCQVRHGETWRYWIPAILAVKLR